MCLRVVLRPPLWATLFLCLLGGVAFSAQVPHRQYSPGSWTRLEELPLGRLRTRIEQLPARARDRAVAWLQGFHFSNLDIECLQVDDQGGIFFADPFTLETTPDAGSAPSTSQAPVPVSPFPSSLVFHSRPGAPNVLYLDFDGENVTGTAWNSSKTTIPALPFSTDTDYTSFSDAEQVAIKRIWERVSEDYAPFNVDVTTERPATLGTRVGHALITRNTDSDGSANPSSTAGGVAYVNVFGSSSYPSYRPAWIYANNLASDESYIAEATAHELGHNLGLSHDGTTDGAAYYGGHGGSEETSWGPLMGTGYNRNVSQWCKGEYYHANNTEDDLAVISAKLTYRTDDHGGTISAATPLLLVNGTTILVTTPEVDPANTNKANKGTIEKAGDLDAFSFSCGTGPVNLSIKPWVMPTGARTKGGNLDVLVQVYNAAGVLIATNNPAASTAASIQTNLDAGTYYLVVGATGVGDPLSVGPLGYTAYGSLGQYFISGTVSQGLPAPPTAALTVAELVEASTAPHNLTVLYTDSIAINAATIDGNDIRVTGPGGFNRLGRLLSVSPAGDATPLTVVYAVDPPGADGWTVANNGTYTVTLVSNQVASTSGLWVAGRTLGTFQVAIETMIYSEAFDSDPGWNLNSLWQYGVPAYASGTGPSSGYTGSKILAYNLSGNYENKLGSIQYATTGKIDCSGATGLTLSFRRWLGVQNGDTAVLQVSTNGINWSDLWVSNGALDDSDWQLVKYPLPSWTDRSSSVQVRWGIGSNQNQNDIGWNLDDVVITAVSANIVAQVHLTAAASPPNGGTVSPSSGTYTVGTTVQLTAIPSDYYAFSRWTGSVSGTNNPVQVTVSANTSITAEFVELTTASGATPYWWLASYGYTNNFEAAADNYGANGMKLWESYVAGMNPTNPASRFVVGVQEAQTAGAPLTLRWQTVPGRVYSLWWSDRPNGVYNPLAGATDLPATVTSFADPAAANAPRYYRLEVTKP